MSQASPLTSTFAERRDISSRTVHPAGTPHRTAYLPHIDGLRGLAILLVVINHAWPSALPGGFIGVDMFFVISGFIITRQILSDREAGSFSYFDFLARRVRRLMPAAFVCFLVVSLLAVVLLLPDALLDYARNLIAATLFYANIYNLHHARYFDAPSDYKPLLHIWSLAIEDQFYLTWPLLLGGIDRLRRRGVTLLAIGAAAAFSLIYAAAIVGRQPDYAFYVIVPRCFPLLLGCALAVATRGRSAVAWPAKGAAVRLAEGMAAVAILGSAWLLNGGVPYPGFITLPVCCGTLVLILSGLSARAVTDQSLAPRLLGAGLPVWLGRISYSLYLWHWPLLALARYRLGRPLTTIEAAILVVGGCVVAVVSWRLIEQPARGRPLVRRRQYAMAAGSIALTCGLAFAIIGGKGWPARLDKPRRDLFVQMSSSNPWRAACDGSALAFANDAACTFGRKSDNGREDDSPPFDMAIFGDSNADHFVPMFAELAARRGLTGRQVTQSTCAPLIGAARDRPPNEEAACTTYQATILAFLDRNPHLKLAILSAVWSGYYGPLTPNRLAATQPPPGDFEGFVASTLALFRSRGIKVMIVGQIPHLKSFSLPCFLDAVETDAPDGQCGTPRAAIEADLSRSLTLFRRLAAQDPGVTLFGPMAPLCGPAICGPFKDGLFAYHDFGHLNAAGSTALARYAALPEDL